MNGPQTCTGFRSTAGFSLVELMVSLVISLIVLAAVSSVMVTSKRANTAETAQARMQDNARIALQIMARDIRQAGYFGCATGASNTFSNDLNPSSNPSQLDLAMGLNGANAGDTAMSPLGDPLPQVSPTVLANPNSDIISVRYADAADSLGVVTPYMTQQSSMLHVAAPNTINPGDILMVTDCNGGDIFQVTNNNPQTSGSLVHNSGALSPGNASGKLSRTYSGDATISKFASNTYFIAQNPQGQPALYRQSPTSGGGTNTDELVDGIDEMRILYGVDTTGDGSANCYIKAGAKCTGTNTVDLSTTAGWGKVYSVRLAVVARTLANNTIRGDKASASNNTADLDTKTYDIWGDGSATYTPSGSDQNYQHHVFRTTVMVRNHP